MDVMLLKSGGEIEGSLGYYNRNTFAQLKCFHEDKHVVERSVRSLKECNQSEHAEDISVVRHGFNPATHCINLRWNTHKGCIR